MIEKEEEDRSAEKGKSLVLDSPRYLRYAVVLRLGLRGGLFEM